MSETNLEIPLDGILNAVFHSTHSIPDAMAGVLNYLIAQAEEEKEHFERYGDMKEDADAWKQVVDHLTTAREAIL